MPDLDQLLATLVADVTASTRAPGAPGVITRARRRRTTFAVAAAVAAVAAVLIVLGGLAAGNLGGGDQPSPMGDPSSPSPTVPHTVGSRDSDGAFGAELDRIVGQVPGWAIQHSRFPDGYDYAFNGPCSGNWNKDATGGGDGGIANFGIGVAGFPSEARASGAASRFVDNLASCTKTAWQVQPIGQTGAVLASSPDAVAWIQQGYAEVHVLQAPTTDGPPPMSVQIAVAEWLAAYIEWQNTN